MAGERDVRSVNVDEPDDRPALVEEDLEERGGLPAADTPQEQEPASGDEPTVGELRTRKSIFDQAREDLTERYAQRRAAALGLVDKPESDDGAAPGASDPGHAAAPAGRVPIKVNGVEVQMDLADVKRIAQESLAAGQTLDTAKARADQMLREAAATRGDAPAPEKTQTTDPNDPAPKKTTLDPARLSSVVDRLQFGLPEEAAESLAAFMDEEFERRQAAAKPQPAEDLDDRVQQVLERRTQAQRAQRALADFSKTYTAIAADNDLIDITMKQLNREMIADFERIGMPAEDIAKAKQNPQLVVESYAKLNSEVNPATGKPWGLRAYDALLDAAGANVSKRFGLEVNAKPGAEPGRIVVDPSRRAAKEALPQQPRSAGLRADAGRLNGSSQPLPAARTPGSQIVAEERRARGLPG